MSTTIQDGTGSNYRVAVTSSNKLKTESVVETTYREAVEDSRAFNINDYDKSLAAQTGDQAIMYIKNNSSTKVIELVNMFGGFWNYVAGTEGTFKVKVWQNVSGGTLISDASEVVIPNRSAGAISSIENDITVYGATAGGKTFTTFSLTTPNAFLIQGSGRLFASIDLAIPAGQTYGITVDTNGGSADYYFGFAGYVTE
jgi:hypothetical protein